MRAGGEFPELPESWRSASWPTKAIRGLPSRTGRMGVVRREGDWRLERVEDGLYEVTYQDERQLKILTSDYEPGVVDAPFVDSVPVREVGAYSDAEELFLSEVDKGAPVGFAAPGSGGEPSLGGDFPSGDLSDLPPGGIAAVLLCAGALISYLNASEPGSTLFLAGVVMAIGGVAILGVAVVLYRTRGRSAAVDFLLTLDEEADQASSDEKTDDVKRTPPAPESLKNDLIFDRAEQHCEWCEERVDHPHVHHIVPRREGGPNEPSNLMVLCPNCHEKADREAIPRSKLKAKIRRVSQ